MIGTRAGRKYPSTNGWMFWKFKDNDGQWKPMDDLRQRALGNRE